jgi:hypothetical protein
MRVLIRNCQLGGASDHGTSRVGVALGDRRAPNTPPAAV